MDCVSEQQQTVAKLPAFVSPQLATLVKKPPAGEGWVHEIKHDGYRTAARIDPGEVKVLTRLRPAIAQ
jgi:bifunctional non-homologous end joining protein LigD